ncbi:MAG: hypothetical protein V1909_05275, partial [Candidatus Micrarchaeota archaeon]
MSIQIKTSSVKDIRASLKENLERPSNKFFNWMMRFGNHDSISESWEKRSRRLSSDAHNIREVYAAAKNKKSLVSAEAYFAAAQFQQDPAEAARLYENAIVAIGDVVASTKDGVLNAKLLEKQAKYYSKIFGLAISSGDF